MQLLMLAFTLQINCRVRYTSFASKLKLQHTVIFTLLNSTQLNEL